MLNIDSTEALARALDSPISPELGSLLRLRRDQLLADTGNRNLADLAQFIVVQPSDTVEAIEAAAGYPVVTWPAFEWVADHGGWYEGVTILSDDGFAVVLLVPDSEDVDSELRSLLRGYVAPSTPDTTGSGLGEQPTDF